MTYMLQVTLFVDGKNGGAMQNRSVYYAESKDTPPEQWIDTGIVERWACMHRNDPGKTVVYRGDRHYESTNEAIAAWAAENGKKAEEVLT